MNSDGNSLVTILNAQNLIDVKIAQSKLEEEQIQSFILDEHITSSIGTAFIEGYKLQVNSKDVEKAKSVIA